MEFGIPLFMIASAGLTYLIPIKFANTKRPEVTNYLSIFISLTLFTTAVFLSAADIKNYFFEAVRITTFLIIIPSLYKCRSLELKEVGILLGLVALAAILAVPIHLLILKQSLPDLITSQIDLINSLLTLASLITVNAIAATGLAFMFKYSFQPLVKYMLKKNDLLFQSNKYHKLADDLYSQYTYRGIKMPSDIEARTQNLRAEIFIVEEKMNKHLQKNLTIRVLNLIIGFALSVFSCVVLAFYFVNLVESIFASSCKWECGFEAETHITKIYARWSLGTLPVMEAFGVVYISLLLFGIYGLFMRYQETEDMRNFKMTFLAECVALGTFGYQGLFATSLVVASSASIKNFVFFTKFITPVIAITFMLLCSCLKCLTRAKQFKTITRKFN